MHAREMGSGGNIYSVDCDLGGGNITGSVNLEGTENNAGVFVELTDLDDYYAYTDTTGVYFIGNIPEGLYIVEYSKTGYETYTSFDGLVVEGETTEMAEVTLISYGDVPQNLQASQATGLTVDLTWDDPVSGTAPGYFVYRRQYTTDPYPDEPLGIVFAENTYSDETALPRVEYYYVVTAMTTGGYQSPYSNEAVGWISSGFIIDEISVFIGTTPVIDGTLEIEEWSDAFCFDASDFWGTYDSTPQPIGSVMGYFKMNPDQSELYVAFENFNDVLLEDHDEVALYIDDNGDGVYPEAGDNSEGNYWAVHYAAGNELRFRPIYNTGGVGDVIYLQNPQVAISDDTGYVVYEFMVPMGEETWMLNPGEENSSSIGIFVLDDNTPDPHGFDSWWPFDNIDIFDPAGYGAIIFDAVPQPPPPPANVMLEELPGNILHLTWDMPDITDFDYFSIYFAFNDEPFEGIDTTVGTSYSYNYEFYPQTSYSFYVTTVNQSGMESEPSEIVEFFTTDINPEEIPLITALRGNYPNPFNPSTTICFSTSESDANTELVIYNTKGQIVRTLVNDNLPAGEHAMTWDGKNNSLQDCASSIYFLVMKSGDFRAAYKLLLMK
ncbi:MAG: T9SS type A sorting domain-containing protein [Candidatus Cloacimonetes bacterium]|nr:T9SS type A sorting domain-containing protein [Candidatus Cloacimonadota bacterium]